MKQRKGNQRRISTDTRAPMSKVLLPLSSTLEARILLPVAEAIVQSLQGQLIICMVVKVAQGEQLSDAAANASTLRQELMEMIANQVSIPYQIKTIVRLEQEIWKGIWELVAQEQISQLLFSWKTPALPDTVVGNQIDEHLANPPCDVIALYLAGMVAKEVSWQAVRSILLPMRGGPYARLTLRIAHDMAESTDANITMLHAAQNDKKRRLDKFENILPSLKRLKRSTTIVSDLLEAVREEAPRHQLLVMGAPSRQIHANGWGGPVLEEMIAHTDLAILVVKTRGGLEGAEVQELVTQSTPVRGEDNGSVEPHSIAKHAVAVRVDQWFAENTFRSREFKQLEQMVMLKEFQGLTISLGLPALNEEETVGNVVHTIKNSLMQDFPLLDEVVVIDSGSTDRTREIAADLGVPVYIHQQVLPQYGAFTGKGEALWKSLYLLRGDIIVWVDTDIKNIHPRFVFGILGPLLRDRAIQYVKGFYRRPLRDGDQLMAAGGGRVTELTARPFINLLFPELSGVIQPLSGEYAGRRSALERVPFFTGYGVEIGLLIDILERFGLSAIAQVDLLERIHHNQPLPSLSKMSFAIMQVVFNRLEKQHRIELLQETNLTMNLIRYGQSRFTLEPQKIRENMRPPMITIPEYRNKFGLIENDYRLGDSSMAQLLGEI